MTLFFYNIGIGIFDFLMYFIAYLPFNAEKVIKIRKLIDGRKASIHTLKKFNYKNKDVVWIHASSVGEFEQAIPLIEEWKIRKPSTFICVSFFSPSGYEQCSKNKLIDFVFYLLSDTKKNAKFILQTIQPKCIIFIKYDYWYHVLHESKIANIPLVIVSSIFRENQIFFKWYGNLFRKMLSFFTNIFVQDEHSLKLLSTIMNTQNVQMAGDVRFDRVLQLSQKKLHVDDATFFEHYTKGKKCIVLGSTLIDDEIFLAELVKYFSTNQKICWICAPHVIDDIHIKKMLQLFPQAQLYSDIKNNAYIHSSKKNILIVDSYGILSKLYRYATIAYVGGGFTKHNGIHNILEPSVYYIPVIIGKYFQKHLEAKELVSQKLCFSCSSLKMLKMVFKELLTNDTMRKNVSINLKTYFARKKGATKIIMDNILLKYNFE